MKILVLANIGMGLYKFRKELLERLISEEHDVYISLPNDEYVPKLEALGCKFVNTNLNRRGTNPLADLKLLLDYVKLIKHIKPDIVLTYTIKPNVYGGIACRITNTKYITNITGLGTAVENQGLIQKITLNLYKLGLKKASCVFFQNEKNQKFFRDRKISKNHTYLLPGSGVNLEEYKFTEYPKENESLTFLFIGRMMKAKGIEELLEAAKIVTSSYPTVQFDLIGPCEEDYSEKIDKLSNEDIVRYHGQQDNVKTYINRSNATILPSYHEGLANVLLESAASGRPVLASNVPGCRETFEEGVSGLGFEVKNVESLVNAIIRFIDLPYEKKVQMGISGRKKIENEYDRNLVIKAYLDEINRITIKEN